MPDFFSQIDPAHPTAQFKEALVALLDAMLQVPTLTDAQKEQLARLRARTQIDLSAF